MRCHFRDRQPSCYYTNDVDDNAHAETVDYNAPNQLIMSTLYDGGRSAQLQQVTQSETRVNISEPQLVTVDNAIFFSLHRSHYH